MFGIKGLVQRDLRKAGYGDLVLAGLKHTTYNVTSENGVPNELQTSVEVPPVVLRDRETSTGVFGIDADNWATGDSPSFIEKSVSFDSATGGFDMLAVDKSKVNRESKRAVRLGKTKYACSHESLDLMREEVGKLTECAKLKCEQVLGDFVPPNFRKRYRLLGILKLATSCEIISGNVKSSISNKVLDRLKEGIEQKKFTKEDLIGLVELLRESAKKVESNEDGEFGITAYSKTLTERDTQDTVLWAANIAKKQPHHAFAFVGDLWISEMLLNKGANDESGNDSAPRDARDDNSQHNRQISGPAGTKGSIVRTLYSHGITVVVVPQENSEEICHYCNGPSGRDAEDERRCSSCGRKLVNSKNKAFNLARTGQKLLADGVLVPWKKNPFGIPADACLMIPKP